MGIIIDGAQISQLGEKLQLTDFNLKLSCLYWIYIHVFINDRLRIQRFRQIFKYKTLSVIPAIWQYGHVLPIILTVKQHISTYVHM